MIVFAQAVKGALSWISSTVRGGSADKKQPAGKKKAAPATKTAAKKPQSEF